MRFDPTTAPGAGSGKKAAQPSLVGAAATAAPKAQRPGSEARKASVSAKASVTIEPTLCDVTPKTAKERMRAYRQRLAEAKKAAAKAVAPKASLSERAKAKVPPPPVEAAAAPLDDLPTVAEHPEVARIFAAMPPRVGKRILYDPIYCDMIIPVAKLGISLTGFAGRLGVSYKTIKEWAKTHEDFGAAVECAKAAMCYGLEIDAVTIRRKGGSPGQATMAMFQMKNLAGHEYADRKAVEHTGPDGTPIDNGPTTFVFNFIPRNKRINLQGEIVDRIPLLIPGMNTPILELEADAEPLKGEERSGG